MFNDIRKQANQLTASVESGEMTLEELQAEQAEHEQMSADQITVENETRYRALSRAIDQLTR